LGTLLLLQKGIPLRAEGFALARLRAGYSGQPGDLRSQLSAFSLDRFQLLAAGSGLLTGLLVCFLSLMARFFGLFLQACALVLSGWRAFRARRHDGGSGHIFRTFRHVLGRAGRLRPCSVGARCRRREDLFVRRLYGKNSVAIVASDLAAEVSRPNPQAALAAGTGLFEILSHKKLPRENAGPVQLCALISASLARQEHTAMREGQSVSVCSVGSPTGGQISFLLAIGQRLR
jgi:hypothetical protein